MKYRFIKDHQHLFPVVKMCHAMNVSRGGYHRWLQRPLSNRTKKNMNLLKQIKQIHTESKERYGSPRITSELHDKGYKISRPRVARLMQKAGIRAKSKRKFKVTTDSNHNFSVAPNLLKRNFSADSPGQVWVSDITYIHTSEGWLYLTVVIDLYSRMVVGWSMSDRMSACETTIAALRHACDRYNPSPGLILHSDRGVQYACDNFKEQLKKHQIIQSMSAKGDCWDNAVAESFFSTLKKELIYCNRYKTRWAARQSIFEYIEIFYNRKRKHSYLGHKSPVQFTTFKIAA